MICEKCGKEHDGSFGSGRFCSRSCANSRSFSEEAIEKKSQSQKAFYENNPDRLQKLKEYANSQSKETLVKARESYLKMLAERPFEALGPSKKKIFILKEQEGKCALCGILQEWNGKYLPFELDHISGDRTDNTRQNLRVICPNCHSQTETYKTKNAERKITDEEMLEALKTSSSVYAAMQKLGLNPHGTHYQRAYKLLGV